MKRERKRHTCTTILGTLTTIDIRISSFSRSTSSLDFFSFRSIPSDQHEHPSNDDDDCESNLVVSSITFITVLLLSVTPIKVCRWESFSSRSLLFDFVWIQSDTEKRDSGKISIASIPLIFIPKLANEYSWIRNWHLEQSGVSHQREMEDLHEKRMDIFLQIKGKWIASIWSKWTEEFIEVLFNNKRQLDLSWVQEKNQSRNPYVDR